MNTNLTPQSLFPFSKKTILAGLFLFLLLNTMGSARSVDLKNNKISKDGIVLVNTADLEVYYEFDAVQVTQSSNNLPLIGTISYILKVTNNGPDEATNIVVQTNYHDEVIPNNRIPSIGLWNGNQWVIPNLPSGATAELVESSNIYLPFGDKWVQASLQEVDQDDPDSTPGDWIFSEDDADKLEIYNPECDLDLTLAAVETEYEIYNYIHYEVVVQNFGPSIATGVSVSIPLPSGTVASSSTSATQGSFSSYSGTWDIGSLDIGQTVLLNLVLYTLDNNGPKTVFAQVQTAVQPDPDSAPGNDTDQTPDEDDEAKVTVYPAGFGFPDLVISVAPTFDEGGPGSTIMQFFDLYNAGNVSTVDPVFVGAFLSVDEVLSADDILVGEYTITEDVEPSEIIPEVPLHFTIPPGQAAGDYYVISYADANFEIEESNEDNNFDVYPFTVISCSGDITLTTQAEVNAFGPCGVWDGDITIVGNDITYFSYLNSLQEITGSLYISSDALVHLYGFPMLEKVGEDLIFYANANLTEIDAFSNLVDVGGELVIVYNSELTNIEPFSSLQSVEEFIFLTNNNVTNIDAFSTLSSLKRIQIEGNNSLENLDGLSNIPSSMVDIKLIEVYGLQNIQGLSHITEITNDLLIAECTNLESLDPLHNLTSVGNNLIIAINTLIENLDGLSSLESVNGGVSIYNNGALQNVDGLSNLLSVGEDFSLTNNVSLTDCCGVYPLLSSNGVVDNVTISSNPFACSSVDEILTTCGSSVCVGDVILDTQAEVDAFDCEVITGNLTISGSVTDLSPMYMLHTVDGSVSISGTTNLPDLAGLSGLSTIGGNLLIFTNEALANINSLSSLSSLGGYLKILFNTSLSNVDGLENLNVINGELWIRENDMLANLDGFSGLTTITGWLGIDDNDVLTNIGGLSSLTTVEQQIAIDHNASLQNLNGLSGLISAGTYLYVFDNDALTNIDGLSGLTFLPLSLGFIDNDALTNLNGVSGVVSIGENLEVRDNDLLNDCCGLFPLLSNNGVGGVADISNNPLACSSVDEILSNCAPMIYCESSSSFPWHEWISKVQLNTLDNSSGKTYYSDFTAINTTLIKGNTYPVTLQTSFSYDTYDEYYRVWIDFDHNGSFTDPEEMVFNDVLSGAPNGSPPVSLAGNITIPNGALTGATRMRVSLQRGSAPTPCSTIPFGEVEDYTVILSGASTPVLELECPEDVYVSLVTSASGAFVAWDLPTYSTTCPTGSVTLNQTGGLPNGSFFPLGIYTITYAATDNCGNQKECFFTIYVEEMGDYCDSQSDFPWHDWISKVSVGEIDNPSGKSKYSDFSLHTASVETGNSYPISLETSYSYTTYNEYWKVWIDYNHNNTFEEPGELAFAGVLSKPANGTPSKTLDGVIDIPMDALDGATRMRVSMKRDAYAMPCEEFPFGEVEDYTIVVSGTSPSPLVVQEVLLLEAQLEDAAVMLGWATNTSFKNDFFTVERSADGITYEPIMDVDNEAEGIQHIYYQEQDNRPGFGLNYYRVKQYAVDGNFKYSNVQLIDYQFDADQFILFPNPVQQELFVHSGNLVGHSGVFQIHDIYGRLLIEKRVAAIPDHPIIFKVNGLGNGLYFLNIKVEDLKMITRRFVVGATR